MLQTDRRKRIRYAIGPVISQELLVIFEDPGILFNGLDFSKSTPFICGKTDKPRVTMRTIMQVSFFNSPIFNRNK